MFTKTCSKCGAKLEADIAPHDFHDPAAYDGHGQTAEAVLVCTNEDCGAVFPDERDAADFADERVHEAILAMA
jgi:hypothetical protein